MAKEVVMTVTRQRRRRRDGRAVTVTVASLHIRTVTLGALDGEMWKMVQGKQTNRAESKPHLVNSAYRGKSKATATRPQVLNRRTGVGRGCARCWETFNRILAWTVAVCIAEDTHSHLPFVFPSENANHMVNTQLCSECLSSECPNDTGAYGCPYSTIYEIPEWYDIRQRYGYEHLPRSLNAQGWTFENTGCRLYGLGLKHLNPLDRSASRLLVYVGQVKEDEDS
ncbi:hypothetical protein B0H11DRAFT_1903818 [Mycena galericulata]|nr:hypothetical protein B0H11DRAFT_1903818 [Mycena galericulata]